MSLVKEKISVKTMQTGDIMVFEGEKDDWICRAIMWLTDSTVSHSALYINENPPTLADAALSGLASHAISDPTPEKKGRPVHISRLKQQEDLTPVIKAAQVYLDQNLPYPKAELVLLASILVYKKFTHLSLKQKIVIKILRLATAAIKSFIDKHFYDGKNPMVCSEFVYQCYLDASKQNPDLKLIVKDGNLQAANGIATLVDHLEANIAQIESMPLMAIEDEPSESAEELAKALIEESNQDDSLYASNPELNVAVRDFLSAKHTMQNGSVKDIKGLILNAKKHQAMFVTPADLYLHIQNTKDMGEFDVWRDDKKSN